MNKIWIVLKTEFINTVSRRSFLVTLILIPLASALILGGTSLFGGEESGVEDSNAQPPAEAQMTAEGLVDQASIITALPDWVSSDQMLEFDSESAAKAAVMDGDIQAYYVIPSDYLESGSIQLYREDISPMAAFETSGLINAVIRYNLLGADQQRFEAYDNAIQVTQLDLSPDEVVRDDSNPLSLLLPYGVTLLFYFLILTSASLMLTNIAKEKENRVMEILLSSLKPNQLLTGKILALGLVGLLQLVVWLGSALLLFRMGGTALNIPANLQLPPGLLPWGIVFFILGYLIYATIMAGVGALVPNLKEASQATFIINLPTLIPLLFLGVIIENPNATLPVVLSLIPFTAPNTIMMRMSVSPVPLWQLIIAIILMILTDIFLIRAVARMFRAQTLLTGQKFSLGLYLKVLLGKEQATLAEPGP